jgi:protein-tyrosine phosphatase
VSTCSATAGNNYGVRAAVDLHCHLLPGIDDGARDLGDAVAMAQQAEADGIEAICATPHIRHDHDVRVSELPARLAELSAAVRQARCRTLVLPGAEVAVTALDALDDRELLEVSLGHGGRWILLEPKAGPLEDDLAQAVDRLRARGYQALVAHPERHLAADLVGRLKRLVARGALTQATAASITHPDARSGMLSLVREGVVHVLGSDAHSSRAGRSVALTAAVEVLGTVDPTARHLEWVARTAPRGIVEGHAVIPPFPPRP